MRAFIHPPTVCRTVLFVPRAPSVIASQCHLPPGGRLPCRSPEFVKDELDEMPLASRAYGMSAVVVRTAPMPPLCKGGWHGVAVTGGLFTRTGGLYHSRRREAKRLPYRIIGEYPPYNMTTGIHLVCCRGGVSPPALADCIIS